MKSQRIFITGASGCIGHYVVESLVNATPHELFLLVRNPDKLQLACGESDRLHILQGDLHQIHQFKDLLGTIDTAILTAAAWGDPTETFDINVTKTIELMRLLDMDRCQQVIYFSTASILDRQNQPLPQAMTLGTDYIRTKYVCHQQLRSLKLFPKITTVFPTLVFGGDGQKPYSHLSGGLGDVMKWMPLIRFFRADGSFHYVHAQDIATVVTHLVDHPPDPRDSRELVLGNDAIAVNQAIRDICQYLQMAKPWVQIPVFLQLANIFIVLFRIQMADWDRFCLNYRHFSYQNPVNPRTFGRSPLCSNITELMQASGVKGKVGKIETQ
ncbi:MAG: NAD(P)-dependent oxidoreductase [Leptolyngbyaceae bacterium]|nr:NAD(P)-dependent oxidoreductase [Leptolyngbyaceae bacterium]